MFGIMRPTTVLVILVLWPSLAGAQGRSLTQLVVIPAGAFTMGSASGAADEQPQHTIELPAFSIERTKVTNQQFAAYLNALTSLTRDGHRLFEADDSDARIHKKGDTWVADAGGEQHPVIEVTWWGARDYCRWAGRRLATEAEWEKAARGTDGRKYPWGDAAPDRTRAHFGADHSSFAAVGSLPAGASPYGVLDMAGNGWEWTLSAYKPYPFWATDGRDDPDTLVHRSVPLAGQNTKMGTASPERVTRGGGQDAKPDQITATYRGAHLRQGHDPEYGHHNVTFRCAQ